GRWSAPFVAARPFPRRVEAISRGSLSTAIRASCAVPLLFRPVRHEGRLLVDGGVVDRAGLTALSEGERAFVHDLPSRAVRTWWRSAPAAAAEGATRRVLCEPALPAVSPDRLEQGPAAVEAARDATERWLDAPFVPAPA